MDNLDATINKVGFEIVEAIKTKGKDKTKYKNYIDKVLGVLSNDGVYAYWIYCKANKIDDIFIKTVENILKVIKDIPTKDDKNNYQEYFQDLSKNLSSLLFTKELIEKALIYARYHAKAVKDE